MARFALIISVLLLAGAGATAFAENPLLDPARSWMPRKAGAVPDPGPCPARDIPWLPPTPHMCAPHGWRRHPMPWTMCYPGDPWVDTYNPKPIHWLPPTLFFCSPHDQCPTYFPGKIRKVDPALDGTEALHDGR